MRPKISFVVAMDRNRLIGAGDALPWRLPDEIRRFKEITMGHPVLMGRKTYESIPPKFRPLKGRTNIVLTRQEDYEAPGCLVVHSLEEALTAVSADQELMVIGGAHVFEALLPIVNRLYLTEIDGEYAGDVYFPNFDPHEWRENGREYHPRDERHDSPFSFLVLDRLQ
ncbi:MAG: dihydrofolate reductase [Candidatus Promineifilaceae bacterium]|jgi:dihydrofolate reductase